VDGVELLGGDIDNDLLQIARVIFGLVAGMDSGMRRIYNFDSFELVKQSYTKPMAG
jgi:hypothetical protein